MGAFYFYGRMTRTWQRNALWPSARAACNRVSASNRRRAAQAEFVGTDVRGQQRRCQFLIKVPAEQGGEVLHIFSTLDNFVQTPGWRGLQELVEANNGHEL